VTFADFMDGVIKYGPIVWEAAKPLVSEVGALVANLVRGGQPTPTEVAERLAAAVEDSRSAIETMLETFAANDEKNDSAVREGK